MIRNFRLTNATGGLGLSCAREGVTIAGVPLLRKTATGFAPRPRQEIAALLEAAYGADPTRLHSSLGVIAEALNAGDLARASIAAVQSRALELSPEAARRLKDAEERLTKVVGEPAYLHEPRDWHGRWTTGGAGSPASLMHPAAFEKPDEESPGPGSQRQTFESKYDELGPTEFAKEVIQFGDRLGREGRNLSPAEKERAAAEYAFLQDRLSLWLGYDDKPPQSQQHLLSAALTLYQGAINGGVARAGELPRSMLFVGGAVAFDAPPRGVRPSAGAGAESTASIVTAPKAVGAIGDLVENGEVGIVWGYRPKAQGAGWEAYDGKQNPGTLPRPSNAAAFDHFNPYTGAAISSKTLNTLTFNNIQDQRRIYWKMKTYIDAAADYDPDKPLGLHLEDIRSKSIHLAVPEYTSEKQWRQLYRAIRYGKERGVSVVITRIRE